MNEVSYWGVFLLKYFLTYKRSNIQIEGNWDEYTMSKYIIFTGCREMKPIRLSKIENLPNWKFQSWNTKKSFLVKNSLNDEETPNKIIYNYYLISFYDTKLALIYMTEFLWSEGKCSRSFGWNWRARAPT